MPWKQYKDSPFRLPTRQEILIIGGSVAICLLVIAYFALTS
ncbi:hypothetical protein [Desulfosporosinus nitroreducens]|nr:hypothetical protein [Desulfosporosinus nitroreducens]